MDLSSQNNIRINIRYNVEANTVVQMYQLINEKLDYALKIANNYELKDALKEIELQEGRIDFLQPEYRDILNYSEQLDLEYKQLEHKLAGLYV